VSILDWAWFAVALVVLGLVVAAIIVMANLFRVLTATKDLIDGVTRQTVPLLGEVGTTVSLVNQELGRVDGILATAEGITSTTGQLVNVVSGTVTSQLVKLSAFAWGLRKAVGAATDDDAPAKRKRGRKLGRKR
jgi:membrane protein implicated in regulation of membrane protease activity